MLTPEELNNLEQLYNEATSGDWEQGNRYCQGYVQDGTLSKYIALGDCPYCSRGSYEPIPVCIENENGTNRVIHTHRIIVDTYFDPTVITSANNTTLVAGTWDYEDGGIRKPEDSKFIVEAHNKMPQLIAYIRELEARLMDGFYETIQ